MFDTGRELEEGEAGDSAEKSADDEEKWKDFFFVLLPAFGLMIFAFEYSWLWYVLLLYAYSGYLYVHVTTRPRYAERLDDLQGVMARLLPLHVAFLIFLAIGEYEWIRYKPFMPEWLTHEGRKGSLYLFLGLLVSLAVGAIEYRILRKRFDRALEQSPGAE